mmetsp:Transcript_11312/g.37219  ORF Transcript_11312/g.37219 Transcript_11312/m.37219 type:complete len:203 (-) Transcript_11312:481-1089(-)
MTLSACAGSDGHACARKLDRRRVKARLAHRAHCAHRCGGHSTTTICFESTDAASSAASVLPAPGGERSATRRFVAQRCAMMHCETSGASAALSKRAPHVRWSSPTASYSTKNASRVSRWKSVSSGSGSRRAITASGSCSGISAFVSSMNACQSLLSASALRKWSASDKRASAALRSASAAALSSSGVSFFRFAPPPPPAADA